VSKPCIVWLVLVSVLLGSVPLFAQPDTESEWVSIQLPDFSEGAAYLLGRLSNEELVRVERSEPVYLALVTRAGIDVGLRREAVAQLAALRETDRVAELLGGLARASDDGVVQELVQFLVAERRAVLAAHRAALITLATTGKDGVSRAGGYASLIIVDGDAAAGWVLAEEADGGLIDFLEGIRLIPDGALRGSLYPRVVGVGRRGG
jgi:hypothetical protein